ncbi:MAG: VOC family protein [Ignavibacteriaceae bacterium]
MILDHVAIWTDNLEVLKDFYAKYFNAVSNDKYVNKQTRMESYFLTFDSGAKIEIMSKPGIPDNLNDRIDSQHKGIIHLAFSVDTKQEVDDKAGQLRSGGFRILRGPRITGDGYYEFESIDPDNNRFEVITKAR